MINYSYEQSDLFLITGASSGIGKAIAFELNKSGASIIITGRSQERLNEVKSQALYSDNIYIEPLDLLEDIDNLPHWVMSLSKKYGKIKGMVLSAGVSFVKPLNLITHESLVQAQDILLNVPIMLIKGFADRRVNTGNSSIVIISANAANYGIKGMIEYGSSKAALNNAAKSIANELYHKNIRVNTISPGLILTPMVEESVKRGETNADLVQYAGKPEHIVHTALFLLSDEANWITGQNINIDGGSSLPNVYKRI